MTPRNRVALYRLLTCILILAGQFLYLFGRLLIPVYHLQVFLASVRGLRSFSFFFLQCQNRSVFFFLRYFWPSWSSWCILSALSRFVKTTGQLVFRSDTRSECQQNSIRYHPRLKQCLVLDYLNICSE